MTACLVSSQSSSPPTSTEKFGRSTTAPTPNAYMSWVGRTPPTRRVTFFSVPAGIRRPPPRIGLGGVLVLGGVGTRPGFAGAEGERRRAGEGGVVAPSRR